MGLHPRLTECPSGHIVCVALQKTTVFSEKEGIKHLVGAAFRSVTTQSPTGTRRASGKDFMRDDLTYGADSAG
jgi:hypothetical protein